MARNKYDIDETLQSEFSVEHLKRLYTYIKPHRKDMLLTIILMMLSSALGMVTPLILKQIMDDYIPNDNIKGIVLISLLLLVIIIVIVIIAAITAIIIPIVVHICRIVVVAADVCLYRIKCRNRE